MQQEEQKKVAVYTAQQNQQHKQSYRMETNTSLKILKSIQTGSTFAKVCQDNLSNLDKVIDRKQVDVYIKEKQNDLRIPSSFLQSILYRFQNRLQMEQEPNQDNSSEDWIPDDQDEDEDSQ